MKKFYTYNNKPIPGAFFYFKNININDYYLAYNLIIAKTPKD